MNYILLFISLICVSNNIFAKTIDCSLSEVKKLPIVYEGCTQEGCADFPKNIKVNISLYDSMDSQKKILKVIPVCSSIPQFTIYERIISYGLGRITSLKGGYKELHIGDMVKILRPSNEGGYQICIRDKKLYSIPHFRQGNSNKKEYIAVELINEPVYEVWLKFIRQYEGMYALVDNEWFNSKSCK